MGIFSKIKEAIFGKKAEAAEAKPAIPMAPAPAAEPAPAAPVAISEVDVEAILTAAAAAKGEELNWRTSIVDLLKLVDIDPSYANRKELAEELGNTDYSGSAEDNILLHKQVMQEIAKNGGKVPAGLTD